VKIKNVRAPILILAMDLKPLFHNVLQPFLWKDKKVPNSSQLSNRKILVCTRPAHTFNPSSTFVNNVLDSKIIKMMM
jgi:hypothetical protein